MKTSAQRNVSVRLAQRVRVQHNVGRSVNVERMGLEHIRGYVPTIRAVEVLGRFGAALTGVSNTRAWSLTGPYGSGKSSFAVFLQALLARDSDEAHRLRNADSSVATAFSRIGRRLLWMLTGTPIERDTEDVATLLATLAPHRFSTDLARQDPWMVRGALEPYFLRRTKETVLSDLPEVFNPKPQSIELNPEQKRSYAVAVAEGKRNANDPGAQLALINRLREICDVDPESGSSAKLDRILEILDGVRVIGEKVVVFSYLLGPLDALEARIAEQRAPVQYARVDGSMSNDEREDQLVRFREDPEVAVLLASSRAAGEGLTLTVANHVIFVNEWWNPSANAQAHDRVIRIGQERPVRIYRFRCVGTVEAVLERILAEKDETVVRIVERLSQGVVGTSEDSPILGELWGAVFAEASDG